MKLSLGNPWLEIGVAMLISAYVLILLSKVKLKNCGYEIKTRGFAAALPFCLKQLRWYFFSAVLAFGASLALVVGTHRLFVGLEVDDSGLILHYPWPRSNVHLALAAVTESKIEVQESGVWRRIMFRLSIKAGPSVYVSPWAGKKEAQQANEAVQAHLGKPQKNSPDN